MGIESAQTHYEGQHGWNDLTPEALDKLSSGMGATRRNRQRPRRVAAPVDPVSISESVPRTSPPRSGSVLPPPTAAPRGGTTNGTTKTKASHTVLPPPPTTLPPPKSETVKPPPAASGGNQASDPVHEDAAALAANKINVKPGLNASQVTEEVDAIFARPSRLRDEEREQLHQKVVRLIPGLAAEHLDFLAYVLSVAPHEKSKARNLLVQYGLSRSNVSAWTTPLRRVVEQQI